MTTLIALTLISLGGTNCMAGLQEALTNALLNLQAADTTGNDASQNEIILEFVRIPLGADRVALVIPFSVDDLAIGEPPRSALYIDYRASTASDTAYRDGPSYKYDPQTGSMHFELPPMLGEINEFGQRLLYSPSQITIQAGEYSHDEYTDPMATTFRRNPLANAHLHLTDGSSLRATPQEPSFVVDAEPTPLRRFFPGVLTSQGNKTFSVGIASSSNWYGAEIHYDQLLQPALSPDLFDHWSTAKLPNYPNTLGGPDSPISVDVVYRREVLSNVGSAPIRVGIDVMPKLSARPTAPEPIAITLLLSAAWMLEHACGRLRG